MFDNENKLQRYTREFVEGLESHGVREITVEARDGVVVILGKKAEGTPIEWTIGPRSSDRKKLSR